MKGIEQILEENKLAEEFRTPLANLFAICEKCGLNDNDKEIVLEEFLIQVDITINLNDLRTNDWISYDKELNQCAMALIAIKLGTGKLTLSSQGYSADISALKDNLCKFFEEAIRGSHLNDSIFYPEGMPDLDEDELNAIIERTKHKEKSKVIECGADIAQMRKGRLNPVLSKIDTQTARNILIGEILFSSGALKDYGLAQYWKYATTANDNARKSHYVRDWEAAYTRQKSKDEDEDE